MNKLSVRPAAISPTRSPIPPKNRKRKARAIKTSRQESGEGIARQVSIRSLRSGEVPGKPNRRFLNLDMNRTLQPVRRQIYLVKATVLDFIHALALLFTRPPSLSRWHEHRDGSSPREFRGLVHRGEHSTNRTLNLAPVSQEFYTHFCFLP